MRQPRYTRRPTVPARDLARTRVLLSVLQGQRTVTRAAQELGRSRVQVQTLVHRGLTGFLQALGRQRAGRPRRPATEAALRQENARLRREVARWQRRAQTTERVLEVATSLLRGRGARRGRAARPAPRRRPAVRHDDRDDPGGGERRAQLAAAQQLRALGLSASRAATVVGVGEATVRRWARRVRQHQRCVRRRGPRATALTAEATATAGRLVRELHGLIGAEALRRSVPGLSRRQAAALKHRTLSTLAQERRAAATRITITQPGVVRAFDAMHVRTTQGRGYLLVASDGAVPYRTSCVAARRYTGPAVAQLLAADFARHGAPLVCRLDRARQHQTAAVRAVLRQHRVLVLHGPPHCARFYGQLERQNREHRQWLTRHGPPAPAALGALAAQLRHLCNTLWRRRTLGWRTAADVWDHRSVVTDDRTAFHQDVQARAARVRRHQAARGTPADLPERLAIEQALMTRGYLRRINGGWC
jgi:transposase